MSRFSPQSNVFTSLREALFKGLVMSRLHMTKWYGLWRNEEFKGVGMLLRKQWDSYTQTSIVMQISSSVKLHVKLTLGWVLIWVNFDLKQEIGPKVGGGRSFARLRYWPKRIVLVSEWLLISKKICKLTNFAQYCYYKEWNFPTWNFKRHTQRDSCIALQVYFPMWFDLYPITKHLVHSWSVP